MKHQTQGWARTAQVAMPASRGKRSLPIFLICDFIPNHILLVGANGCSPEDVKGELHLTAFSD